MITYNDINALPTTGVALTVMTRDGIRTYSYECHDSVRLASIINGTVSQLDPAYGEALVSVWVG